MIKETNQLCIKYVIALMVLLECKTEKAELSMWMWTANELEANKRGGWYVQQLAVNHNNRQSLLANEFNVQRVYVLRTTELVSCQSYLCHSWGYQWLHKFKDSIKA